MGLRPVDDVRTAPLTALELVGGHLVARESGICPLGGALLGAAGLCAGRTWLVEGGPAVAGGLGVLYLLGFGASVLAVVSFWVMIHLPGFGDDYGLAKQAASETALGPVWQIVLASVVGFLAGQLSNAWVMARLKRRSHERHLVLRLMGSTGVGEALDTILFCTIAASAIGITSLGQWANYVFFGFLWKTLVEYAFVPVTRLVIGWLKRHEPSYAPTPEPAP